MKHFSKTTDKLILLLAITTAFSCSSMQDPNHTLPRALQNKPIFHEKVEQIQGWSCGYNALYNACKLEQKFGRDNIHSQLWAFEAVGSAFLHDIDAIPTNASTNVMLEGLAKQLQLQRFCCLRINEQDQVQPIMSEGVRIRYRGNATPAEIKKMLKNAQERQSDEQMELLKAELDSATGLHFIHFVCHVIVEGSEHFVLLSVVKNDDTLSLHICDNLNSSIYETSAMKYYIDYISLYFNIN